MSDIAFFIDNVSKSFRMYGSPSEKFKELIHPFKKTYHKEFHALKNISFSVRKGESLGLVGRNGAGKSTLLQVICGILQPSSGRIHVNGTISALLELGAGFNKEFTGRENIYINGSLRGFTKKGIDERYQKIVDFAEIGDFIEQPVKTYSSGMFVRLAFSNAIHIDPEILIVDEALAVGDQLFQRKCYSFLEKFRGEGKTLIFVSHSTMNINQLCSRALLIDGGEVILDGTAQVVTTQYERLLFSNPAKTHIVRNEIIDFNKSLSDGMNVQHGRLFREERCRSAKSDTSGFETVDRNNSNKSLAKFIPNFIPKSTVEYKNYDVELRDIQIETILGEKVNSLIMDEEYIVSYSAIFGMEARDVSFGITIKTNKGVPIGAAASFEVDSPIPLILPGEEYYVRWKFRCYLLPETYFLDIGCSSVMDDTRRYLNRVIDGGVFKVEVSDRKGYYGIVNFNLRPFIQKKDVVTDSSYKVGP